MMEDEEVQMIETKPFRFFDLPFELRLRVYEEVLKLNSTIDLDPMNFRRVLPLIRLFHVSHQFHEEASRIFYGQTMRLFPTHGRFFHTKKPLLARLPTKYRNVINTLELRLGPGWSDPPRGQKITPQLHLEECINLRRLRIFIELDPSEAVFSGFRGRGATEETYKEFCLELLAGIFSQAPTIEVVEIDAYPGVKADSPLLHALKSYIKRQHKSLIWGPLRGWTKASEPGVLGLESMMANMSLESALHVVDVQA